MAEEVVVKTIREAAVGKAYSYKKPTLTVHDILTIKNDPHRNLYIIPFGPARGEIVVRELREMNWKLKPLIKEPEKRKAEFFKRAEKHGALADALRLAIKISKAYARTKGVTKVVLPDGRVTFYPTKALAQRKWREEHPELVEEWKTKVVPKAKMYRK